MSRETFDRLVSEAQDQAFTGWDFGFLRGRWRSEDLPWDYPTIVVDRMRIATALLDMGTGGGEFLSGLAPLPETTWATEGYPPNAPIAQRRLAPLGVQVVQYAMNDHPALPFEDATFDMIINRHEGYDAGEVFRVLRSGGRFITQQVGGENCMALNRALNDPATHAYSEWTLANAVAELEAAGLAIERAQEAFPLLVFYDIGAVVFYLKAVPWQVEDFSVEQFQAGLFQIHEQIERDGNFPVPEHRFIIEAVKA